MKKGRSLAELAAELERQAAVKADYVADTREMTLLTTPEADTGSPESGPRVTGGQSELHIKDLGEYEVKPLCHQQIGLRLGIPKKFYDRLRGEHPALLDHNVNTLFREHPERRMVRTLDGNARAFLSDRYRRRDNLELAEAVLPVLGEIPDVQFPSCELTDTRLYIKAVSPRLEAEVKVGDLVQAGVVISNSEVGLGSLSVQPMIYRLSCLNGMISADRGVRRYHVGKQAEDSESAYEVFRDETMEADDRAFFMKVTDVVKAAVTESQFLAIVEQMREATGRKIEGDPVKAVEKLANRYSMGEGERGNVLGHLIEGGDLSAYGMLNAVTRASQDIEDYDRATEFERVGGEILALPPKEWSALATA